MSSSSHDFRRSSASLFMCNAPKNKTRFFAKSPVFSNNIRVTKPPIITVEKTGTSIRENGGQVENLDRYFHRQKDVFYSVASLLVTTQWNVVSIPDISYSPVSGGLGSCLGQVDCVVGRLHILSHVRFHGLRFAAMHLRQMALKRKKMIIHS